MNKVLVLGLVLFLCMPMLRAQRIIPGAEVKHFNTCEFPVIKGGEKISKPYQFKSSSSQRELTFNINYLPAGTMQGDNVCTDWPAAAQAAFTFAAHIWSDVLESALEIGVSACWTSTLGGNTLGTAGPTNLLGLSGGGLDLTFFPVALAENLTGAVDTTVHISANFNANRNDWYFGTDATPPANELDFVSVVLHELGHGLGFLGAANIDDGLDGPECDGLGGNGCVGFRLSDGSYAPSIYDRFINLVGDESPLLDQVNPSMAIANLLTGGDGSLEFDSTNLQIRKMDQKFGIHTPAAFSPGSSYSHFSETLFPNELMSPSISAGQGIHDVGEARTVMAELGWLQAILPVDLLSFTASASSESHLLNWSTATETNNDFFEIQRSQEGKLFHKIGRVRGSGTSYETNDYHFLDRDPHQGANYYRLKQVDYDGSWEYSKVIHVNSFSRPEISFYPNPVRDIVNLIGLEKDHEKIAIYNLSGKQVYKGVVTNSLDLSTLPIGTYQMVVTGNTSVTLRLIKQ